MAALALRTTTTSALPAYRPNPIGMYRATEADETSTTPVYLRVADMAGHRLAIFGKTRSGKTVILHTVADALAGKVGQLIFDVQGELSNTRQFTGRSFLEAHPADCVVYAISPLAGAKELKLNFYYQTDVALHVLVKLMDNRSNNTQSLLSVVLPFSEDAAKMPLGGERMLACRKVLLWWAILHAAGYSADEGSLMRLGLGGMNPCFRQELREAMYGAGVVPPAPHNLASLARRRWVRQVSSCSHCACRCPHRVHHIKRLGYAAELLLGGSLSALEVCNQAGFNNPNHFYHLFKEHYGCPPGRFNAMYRLSE